MARFNEILVGRYNRFLQRFLSIKGGPPAAQLASEISPQFELDDAQNLENRFPATWRSYGSALNSAAVAGQFSAVRIFNPAGSGVVGVIEKILLANSANLNRLINGVTFGSNVSGAIRDIRMGASQGSTCQLTVGSAVSTTGATLIAGVVPVGDQRDLLIYEHEELALLPGDSYTLWGNVVNQTITVSLFWRERVLEEGELT